MKNGRNYVFGMALSIILCALSAVGFVRLPELSTVMNVLIVVFILALTVCTFKWMGQGSEETAKAVNNERNKTAAGAF